MLDEILRVEPESAAALWDEAELDLKSFWPGSTGTDEAIESWTQLNGFEPVFAGASNEEVSPSGEDAEDGEVDEGPSPEEAEAELRQVLAEAQSDTAALDSARIGGLVELMMPEQLASEDLVNQLVVGVVRTAAEKTSQAQPDPPAPSREHYSQQRDVVSQYQSSLALLLPGDQPALRRQTLSTIQAVCQDLSYPSRELLSADDPNRVWNDELTRIALQNSWRTCSGFSTN